MSRSGGSQRETSVIIVTGANGQLGRAIVERLLTRVPADQLGVSARDPGKAAALAGRGVRTRRGDYRDPASLAHAFEGAEQVLIVSADSTGQSEVRQHGAAIDAAKAAGAKRILYTSHMGSAPDSLFAPMRDHAATEALLRDSGVDFTSLRNGFYASTVSRLLGPAFQTGELAAPPDGPVSWTDHADLAEVAAIALTADGGLDGLTPPLTGAEAIDLTRIAGIASEVAGRPVRRVVVPGEQYRDGPVAHGAPAAAAEMLIGMFAASRQGEFAAVDPTLERMIGRPPVSVRDVLTRGAAGREEQA
jgi:uncharacterized protein YbjT (DUF2867 family)